MRQTRAKASRKRIAAVSIFLLASAAASPNVAMPEKVGTVEECEPPLGRLVTLLESKRQLTGTKGRYKGEAFGSDYSRCRILQQGRSWPQYAVFRTKDDVTVVIEKRLTEGDEPVLYGPFQSAYRK